MENKKQSLLSWRIDKEELNKQVIRYHQLKLHQSFRGISTLILSFGFIASVIASIFLSFPITDILFTLIIGLVLIYFVYNGHRWAMVVSILYFTTNVLVSSFDRLIDGTFTNTSLILIGAVWLITVGYLVKAVRIENYRRRNKHSEKSELSDIEECSAETKEDKSWQKHFTPKNLLINALISLLPASLVIGILREMGLGGALVIVGVLSGFIYLVGLLREKIRPAYKRWFGQLIALVKSNSHKTKLILVLTTAMLVTGYGYLYFTDVKSAKSECLQKTIYRDRAYTLRDANDAYVKRDSGKLAKFGTYDEAMEYCLTFRTYEK